MIILLSYWITTIYLQTVALRWLIVSLKGLLFNSIVSNGFFNPDYLVGPTGTLIIVLGLSVDCDTKLYTKSNNWVTGSKAD